MLGQLLRQAISATAGFQAEAESAGIVQVERGVVLADAAAGRAEQAQRTIERLLQLAESGQASRMAVADRLGQRREVYHPLLIYAWSQALRRLGSALAPRQRQRWLSALEAWSATIPEPLAIPEPIHGAFRASEGDAVARRCWQHLARCAAATLLARDRWITEAVAAFTFLAAAQQPSGAFLRATAADNPETHWYFELVLLHAAASFCGLWGKAEVLRAVQRAAEFHALETQPDHASNHPWAVHAFLASPAARPLAEQVLHASNIQNPAGVSGIAAILLADAAIGIETPGAIA